MWGCTVPSLVFLFDCSWCCEVCSVLHFCVNQFHPDRSLHIQIRLGSSDFDWLCNGHLYAVFVIGRRYLLFERVHWRLLVHLTRKFISFRTIFTMWSLYYPASGPFLRKYLPVFSASSFGESTDPGRIRKFRDLRFSSQVDRGPAEK